jgi:hypothetical protein
LPAAASKHIASQREFIPPNLEISRPQPDVRLEWQAMLFAAKWINQTTPET